MKNHSVTDLPNRPQLETMDSLVMECLVWNLNDCASLKSSRTLGTDPKKFER